MKSGGRRGHKKKRGQNEKGSHVHNIDGPSHININMHPVTLLNKSAIPFYYER